MILSLPIALAVIGVAVRWNRSRTSSLPETNLRQITILAIAYLCFWIGVGYHVLVTFMNQGVSASTGWYLYCLVAAEVVLLIWGLEASITSKLIPLLCTGVALMDWYGMHALKGVFLTMTGLMRMWVVRCRLRLVRLLGIFQPYLLASR